MPKVGGKKYPYTTKGKAAAKKAKAKIKAKAKKKKSSGPKLGNRMGGKVQSSY
jgi:hypothetical protein|tara:strand:- start:12671 stop:12829 length:159 start_codon:yes stop_codon:yes gene_type:complete